MSKVKQWHKRCLCAVLMGALLAGVSGCGEKQQSAGMDENLLLAEREKDKLMITLTCQAPVNHFAAAVNEKFPDVQLVQDIYQGDYMTAEHIARVEHGDLGDLVMFKAGVIPLRDLSEQLLDLSTKQLPASYPTNALQMDEEGHIYLIPGPLNFNGHVYNKTLFDEQHWLVPETYAEFLTLCQEIDENGIRGCRYVYADASMQVFNFCVRSAVDTLTQVSGQTWHNELLAGKTQCLEPLEIALQDLSQLMAAGIVRPEDLTFTSDERNEALLDRRLAIGAAEINTLRKLNSAGSDEFCFMPHFSMTNGQGWLISSGYYYGANKNLQQPENADKLQAALAILDFVATQEGQQLLMEDGLGLLPATRGAVLPEEGYFDGIRKQIEQGYYIMRPVYGMLTPVLDTEVAAYVQGRTGSEAVLEKCSAVLEQGAAPAAELGQAEKDFTVLETGQLKADALQMAAQTDLAFMGLAEADGFVPIAATRTRLYQGSITEEDVWRVAQSKLNTPFRVCRAEMTGEAVLALLEQGAYSEAERQIGAVSHFHPYAVAGLALKYDGQAAQGQRVSDVRLTDGSDLTETGVYTVAYLEGALPQAVLSEAETLPLSMTEALRAYILAQGRLTPDERRIQL